MIVELLMFILFLIRMYFILGRTSKDLNFRWVHIKLLSKKLLCWILFSKVLANQGVIFVSLFITVFCEGRYLDSIENGDRFVPVQVVYFIA